MPFSVNPQTGEPALTESLTVEEKEALVSRVAELTREGEPGVSMDVLRPFYPHMNWIEMKLHLNELVSDGALVTKSHKPRGAKVAYEVWGLA